MVPEHENILAYAKLMVANRPASMLVWAAKSEADFYAAVELALSDAFFRMEQTAAHYFALDEPTLSTTLTNLLSAASIPAAAEGYHNGHVDVTVTHPIIPGLIMLGECKIYEGYLQHCGGCKQLLERYAGGRSSRTFCLDFFKKPKMYTKMRVIRSDFDKKKPLKQIGSSVDHSIKGGFVTRHRHFTDASVEVLHLCCNVYHPETAARSDLFKDDSERRLIGKAMMLLQVKLTCKAEDVRRAFRKAITEKRIIHPDKGGDAGDYAHQDEAYRAMLAFASRVHTTKR